MKSLLPVTGPCGGSNGDEVAIGLNVSARDDGLHCCGEREACGAVSTVFSQAEELSDADLDREPLPDMLLQLLEIAAYPVAVGVMFVDQSPAIADEPAIDPM